MVVPRRHPRTRVTLRPMPLPEELHSSLPIGEAPVRRVQERPNPPLPKAMLLLRTLRKGHTRVLPLLVRLFWIHGSSSVTLMEQ